MSFFLGRGKYITGHYIPRKFKIQISNVKSKLILNDLLRVDAEEIEDGVFFVAAVTAGVNPNGGKFAPFAPTFEGEGGDAEDIGDFADGEQVGKVI